MAVAQYSKSNVELQNNKELYRINGKMNATKLFGKLLVSHLIMINGVVFSAEFLLFIVSLVLFYVNRKYIQGFLASLVWKRTIFSRAFVTFEKDSSVPRNKYSNEILKKDNTSIWLNDFSLICTVFQILD